MSSLGPLAFQIQLSQQIMSEIEFTSPSTSGNTADASAVANIRTITSGNGANVAYSNAQAQETVSSKTRTAAIITCITCSTGLANFVGGTVIVALPSIISDLKLSPEVALCESKIPMILCFRL